MSARLVRAAVTLVCSALGIAAFLAPFFVPALAHSGSPDGALSAPLLLSALVTIAVVALIFEAQGPARRPAGVALIGVLVGINSMLRLLENAIPGPGGFSPIFLLIILAGYVFGGQFGLLTGALTLLVSALITGGVGPWLPYQMFAAGWVGLSAPLCRPLVGWLGGAGRRREVWVLAGFGALWGLLFGAIMNLSFWPYTVGSAALYWAPGVGGLETLRRYAAFYLLTSFVWDLFGALGNLLLLLVFGRALLRALRRFEQRLGFTWRPQRPAEPQAAP